MTATPTRTTQPATGPLLREAVGRLLFAGASPPAEAVTRFIRDAPGFGIDLDLLTAVVQADGQSTRVRQVCMPVVGAGRTAMLFVSGPGPRQRCGTEEEQAADRAAAIVAGVARARDRVGERVSLLQALSEPGETWASNAYERAGLRRIAELLYLGRPLSGAEARPVVSEEGLVSAADGEGWPEGVRVRTLAPDGRDEPVLERTLERTYVDTRDCPELAGLRRTPDIVASHRAVGEFDPRLWWLVEREDEPLGCLLLNRCEHQGCVELVYIGLAPAARGLGLGRRLMGSAIAAASALEGELRCAVDARNEQALRMYRRLGFRETGRRLAFVALADELLAGHVPQR